MRLKLSLRFLLPLALALGLIAWAALPIVESLTFRWFARDLDIRAEMLSRALEDSIASRARNPSLGSVEDLFRRVMGDERLAALAFCDNQGHVVARTSGFVSASCDLPGETLKNDERLRRSPLGDVHMVKTPIHSQGQVIGELLVVHDLAYVRERQSETQNYVLLFLLVLGAVVAAITVIVAQLSWQGWVQGVRSLMKGEGLIRPLRQADPDLRPIARDLKDLVRDLENARASRDQSQITWTPKVLKEILQKDLFGDEVLIVSNREPYIHNRKDDGQIEISLPASGLVTALEPIMRACSGTWIAHGAGSADRDVVDKHDRVAVPPDDPSYQIRRIWLSKEEEAGYYYGFANEGLWALCHIAHVRPIFRSADWDHYVAINRRFARAVAEEAKTDDPVVLVQDYHFALLPKMIKQRFPKATVITFWHIPFPNPEVFGICPWREDLIEGLLGSDILGFHTRFHCNNFIETVDRFMESRIDRETSTISYQGHLTDVKAYPISIEDPVRWMKELPVVDECRRRVREANGIAPDGRIGVGVDRLDYTKGILERFLAVERLLEREPRWIGRFSFIQIAAPSRSTIEQYQRFDADVHALADRINSKFGRDDYRPIHLRIRHHGAKEVFEYYRASDLCFVSSLHDGMNLVAKEFIAARDDEQGVLLLSQFTGASRELPEALIVNPYDIDQCATALAKALEMPPVEQRDRMRSMRGLVREFNVFRWAGRMLMDAARLRHRRRLLDRHVPRDSYSIEVSL